MPVTRTCRPRNRAAWRAWLERNHANSTGVWLISYKKSTGKQRLSYDDAVEEALCFGWIDSLTKRYDDERSMQLFTPRAQRSPWSPSNKTRVKRLIAAGAMAPAGMAAVDLAKKNGLWRASQRRSTRGTDR